VSGPFQCWSYLVPGKYAEVWNYTYLPTRFRCMQIGVTWSPDMTTSSYIEGERDEVVFKCQQKCQDTEGCQHFTVMFPGLCRLADESSVPLPAEQAISGPPTQECDKSSSEAPLGHTFMRKYTSSAQWVPSRLRLHADFAGPVAIAAGSALAALVWFRRRSSRSGLMPLMVDLEESLQVEAQE